MLLLCHAVPIPNSPVAGPNLLQNLPSTPSPRGGLKEIPKSQQSCIILSTDYSSQFFMVLLTSWYLPPPVWKARGTSVLQACKSLWDCWMDLINMMIHLSFCAIKLAEFLRSPRPTFRILRGPRKNIKSRSWARGSSSPKACIKVYDTKQARSSLNHHTLDAHKDLCWYHHSHIA